MASEIIKLKDAVESQLRKTNEVIAGNEAVTGMISKVKNTISDVPDAISCIDYTISSGFSEVNDVLSSGFDMLDGGLQEINYTLSSGFNLLDQGLQELCFITKSSFLEIIDRLELQSGTLKAIKEILERPLGIQAKELRKRAEFAYLNNWINEAETDLLEAEKKNYQDFIIHQILGNIYYHHKKNYLKAIEYYQKAAKYAAPVSARHASHALICASMVHYRIDHITNAYKATEKALKLSPNDPHVLYHHARYSAKMGYEFINFLKKSVRQDPHYLVTAGADGIFSKTKERIQELAEELRDEEKKEVDHLFHKINLLKKEAETTEIGSLSLLNEQLKEIERMYSFNTYLNFQKDFLEPKRVAQDFYEKRLLDVTSLLNEQLAEMERLYSFNSYFDFLGAKKIGQNAYLDFRKGFLRIIEAAKELYPKNIRVESLSALITIKEADRYTLKKKEQSINSSNWGLRAWGCLVFLMTYLLSGPIGFEIFGLPFEGSQSIWLFIPGTLPIVVGSFTPRMIRAARHKKINAEIKKEELVFEKLLHIKEVIELNFQNSFISRGGFL